jgi:multiple sugar transport system ATP-binding protein
MIYVTHDQVEAMTMGDRIVIMKDGIIQQVGHPLEVFRKPKNLFVAEFIGSPSINLIECKLIQEDSNLYISASDLKLMVPPHMTKIYENYVNRHVIFGIRPEYIYDSILFSTRTEENTLYAMVEVIETLGSEIIIYFSINDISLIGKLDADTDAKMGQSMDISLDMNKMYLFDPESEKLIQ